MTARAHHGKLHPGQLNMVKHADTIPDGENSLLLDDQLCFALHAAARAMSSVYMETLRDHGLTYPQYLVLICLFEEDGLTVGQLGRRLQLDSGTLTPLLKRLEIDGAVIRRRANHDERRVEVRLTAKGRGYRDVAKRARAVVLQRLRMTNQELSNFRGQLANMTERLRNENPSDE